jgi:hypothetical protein
MGAREFLTFFAFPQIFDNLEIASSTCVQPESKN